MMSLMNANGVKRYSTENEEKSMIVERWNRTIKEKIWKLFSAQNEYVYLDKLKEIVDEYNNSVHSSTGMTPVKASLKGNEKKVYAALYEDELWRRRKAPKFTVGDRVRITASKKAFEKGFTPKWTEEIFIVKEIRFTKPVTYKLKDLLGEDIDGSFYEKELQKAEQKIFRIEEVLDRDEEAGEVFVKWSGYPEKFNEWISIKDYENIENG